MTAKTKDNNTTKQQWKNKINTKQTTKQTGNETHNKHNTYRYYAGKKQASVFMNNELINGTQKQCSADSVQTYIQLEQETTKKREHNK